jgi:hypothetical protein
LRKKSAPVQLHQSYVEAEPKPPGE